MGAVDMNLAVILGVLASDPVRLEPSETVRYLVEVKSETPRRRVDVLPVLFYPASGVPAPTGKAGDRFWASCAVIRRGDRLELVAEVVTVKAGDAPGDEVKGDSATYLAGLHDPAIRIYRQHSWRVEAVDWDGNREWLPVWDGDDKATAWEVVRTFDRETWTYTIADPDGGETVHHAGSESLAYVTPSDDYSPGDVMWRVELVDGSDPDATSCVLAYYSSKAKALGDARWNLAHGDWW